MDLEYFSFSDDFLSLTVLTAEFGVDAFAFPGALGTHRLDLLNHSRPQLMDPDLHARPSTGCAPLYCSLLTPTTCALYSQQYKLYHNETVRMHSVRHNSQYSYEGLVINYRLLTKDPRVTLLTRVILANIKRFSLSIWIRPPSVGLAYPIFTILHYVGKLYDINYINDPTLFLHNCDYLSFEKDLALYLNELEFPLITKGWFVPNLIKISLLVLEKIISSIKTSKNVFCLLWSYLTSRYHHFHKLESALCQKAFMQIWVFLACWFSRF
jgi:hypothetical protein